MVVGSVVVGSAEVDSAEVDLVEVVSVEVVSVEVDLTEVDLVMVVWEDVEMPGLKPRLTRRHAGLILARKVKNAGFG